MERLNNALKKIDKLRNIQGSNAKKEYLTSIDDDDFKKLMVYRYDKFKSYNIKKLSNIPYKEDATLTFDEYISLLDELEANNINNAMRKKVEDTLSKGNYEYGYILEGIITKGLSLGVDTTVKKLYNLTEIECALASPIKENTKMVAPWIVELKYDGVRCIAIVKNSACKLYTRQGRRLSFPQLEKEFVELAKSEDITFDCELETSTRTGVSGICNSNLKSGYVQGQDDLIQAIIFDEIPTDVFLAKGKTLPQKERTANLQRRLMNHKAKRLKVSESQTVHSWEKLVEINKDYIDKGFEGVIIKDPSAPYAYKRSSAWLKLKAINSTTLKIIAVEYGKGKREGKVGALVCESQCGNIHVKVGSGLNDDDIEVFTNNPPIGKFIEVLFNILIKPRDKDTYSLFLPRYKELRIDKEEADTLEKVKGEHIGKIENGD